MKRSLLIFVALLGSAFATQMATPTFSQPAGTYINSVFITIQSTTSGFRICYSLNGVTPTAAVAGTCDSGFYSSTWAFAAISASGTQLCAIATEAAFTNSAVFCATYTITQKPYTNPISALAPVKVTSAGANVIDELPLLLAAPNGTMFLFYSEGTGGLSIDNGGKGRVMFKTSSDGGVSWVTPSSVNCPGGDPATGCFYDDASAANASIMNAGGVAADGTMIVLMAQSIPGGGNVGEVQMTSTNNGATWSAASFVTTPTYNTPSQLVNAGSNIVSIPPGSPGVTGPCSSGCIFTTIDNPAGNLLGVIFSYNDGATWSDPVTGGASGGSPFFPGPDGEFALFWLGGMNLMMFARPAAGQDQSSLVGWPQVQMFIYSSDLVGHWNSYIYNGSVTAYGALTNLPVSTCSVSPGTNWSDTFTRPAIVAAPGQSGIVTLLYGERLSSQCGGPALGTFRWQIVTFDAQSAFANNGHNLPLPQILPFDTVTTSQQHTTYSYLAQIPGTAKLLMTYEQGNTSSTEDIYTTVISYASGIQVSGGVNFSGGVTIQ
jgi:hypothetical protein